MVLPALALIAKPIACSMTDAHKIHKQFLIGALSVFGLSYGSLAILPFFKDPQDHSTDTLAWIITCGLMTFGYVSCACIFCMNDALASNYARKHNKSYGRMRVFSNTGWATGALVLMVIGDVSWLPFRVPGLLALMVCIFIDVVVLLLWPYPEDFEMFHDGSTVEQRKLSIVGPNTRALMQQMKPRKSISQDMLEKIRAGRSKSVGGVPRLQTLQQQDDKRKKTEPKQKEYSNFQCQMILIKMIATEHKSFTRYIVLFTIFGFVQSMVWNYQLDFFEARVAKNRAEFEFMSTLCMIAQSVFGEIIINIISADMIRLFGANANVSLALVSLGLRCYYYSNLLPYLGSMSVIIAEALQGPSLALYWVLAVDIGSNYALMVTDFMPELKRRGIVRDRVHEEELSGCLRATTIGIFTSSMEGLGMALGALLGGIISSNLGYDTMWNLCALISISAGFINIGWDLVRKLVLNKGKKESKQTGVNNNNLPTIVVEDMMVKMGGITKL